MTNRLRHVILSIFSCVLSIIVPILVLAGCVIKNKGKFKYRYFALSYERFGKDLQTINDDSVCIYPFPTDIQYYLIALYRRFFEKYQQDPRFLEKVFFRLMPVDGFLSASLWYKQDLFFAKIAQKHNKKYIVFHKESFKYTTNQLNGMSEHIRLANNGCFPGSHISVHNSIIGEYLQTIEETRRSNISVDGAVRFDNLRKYRLSPKPKINEGTIYALSFTRSVGLDMLNLDPFPKDPRLGWAFTFHQFHSTLLRYILDNPKTKLVFRLKWKSTEWEDQIKHTVEESLWRNVRNRVTFESDTNLWAELRASSAVVGFSSTALYEAAYLGVKAIFPLLGEANSIYSEEVKLPDDAKSLFYTPGSPDELISSLNFVLNSDPIGSIDQGKIDEIFAKYISKIDGRNIERWRNLLIQ